MPLQENVVYLPHLYIPQVRQATLAFCPADANCGGATVQDDVVYLLYQLPTVVISRRTDQYSKAHEILTGVSANAAKRPRTAPQFPPQAASVPPPAAAEASLDRPSRLAHASSAPEGAHLPPPFSVKATDIYLYTRFTL